MDTILDNIGQVVSGSITPHSLGVDRLATICSHLNDQYRRGEPLVSDQDYDHLFVAALAEMAPEHPFLAGVEPEPDDAFGGGRVRHERPMLSTEKAYTEDELRRFLTRIERAAEAEGIDPASLVYRATAKLDGIAGNYSDRLVSRGNGLVGSDLTAGVEWGLTMEGGRNTGLGEIVVDQAYFLNVLQPQFGLSHPRNYVAGFFAADQIKDHHREAVEGGYLRFVPYSTLPAWEGSAQNFLADWREVFARIREKCAYLTDGVVLELVGPESLKAALGSTGHHHRWQIAIKSLGDTAVTTVTDVRFQAGRTGRVTPVMAIDCVTLDGAVISNVTAHTARTVERLGIGPGAVVEITRSGGVIPKLLRVISPAPTPATLTACPSCGGDLVEDGEYAVCPNTAGCAAQSETRITHFFKTVGTADLFGPATVGKLVKHGITDLLDIYAMKAADFEALGFGPGQSRNLEAQLARSLTEEIPDWRFLGAIGLRHLGRGDSKKLLRVYSLDEVLAGITADQIRAIDGFGDVTSPLIAEALAAKAGLIQALMNLGFRLSGTRAAAETTKTAPDSAMSGLHVVFTGALLSAPREEMKAQAEALGAVVQSSVNAKTDILVAGERAGSKLKKAQEIGDKRGSPVRVLGEAEWLNLIGAN